MIADLERMIKAGREAQDVLGAHRRMLDLSVLLEKSGLRRIMANLECSQEMARLVAGPFEELRRAGAFEQGVLVSRELEQMRQTMAAFEARFRLPEIAERVPLLMELPPGISETLKRYEQEQSSFRRAMESMRTPWLDMEKKMRSIGGMAALHGIGHAVRNMPAFGEELNAALRIDLGDWRDPIKWPPEVLTTLDARSAFYVERGFNPALTDFPASVFEESLDLVGLDHEPPPLVTAYGEPIAASDNEDEEEELNRTSTAHDWLLRLETQVRRLIDEEMTKAFGHDWPKHRLPGGLCDKWKDKQQKARQSGGRDWPLIAYADFTDYILVIGRRDNWGVFAPFFKRLEDVRESFQRLHPIRLDTMHARPITQDDELLLYVEVRRLLRVMTRK